MNAAPINRVASAIGLVVALSACTTTIEISHSETRKVDTLSDDFRMVSTQEIPDPFRRHSTDVRDGFFLVELKSEADLEKIIRQREMAVLYYELRPCGGSSKSLELFSAPAYINAQAASIETGGFYYYAPVPQDYEDEIDRYQGRRGKDRATLSGEICIGLGAGNMAFQSLTTNFVRAELN